MPDASAIRFQVESALAHKVPSALTPRPKMVRPVAVSGIENLDDLLHGGFPVGALSEMTGPECSGRTSVALSLISQLTKASKVCAWIDVSNSFDPASAASVGVDLRKLLWVRCGVQHSLEAQSSRQFALQQKYLVPRPAKKGLHGGGFGPHPRTEVRGMANAVGELLASRCDESHEQHRPKPLNETGGQSHTATTTYPICSSRRTKHYDAIEQGIRSADLILQSGGFSAVVLDMGCIAPEFVARVELSTWHRYRMAAERTQAIVLLLTQYPCAKSSSELQLRFSAASEAREESTVFSGIEPHVEIARRRFVQSDSKVIPLRKPPSKESGTQWQHRTTWVVPR